MTQIIEQPIRFQTADGVVLGGHLFAPAAPRAVAVIAGATGCPEGMYHAFARWLAETCNIAALTFTYRDMHDTTPRAMRRSRAWMSDWAIADTQAARDAARGAFADVPVWMIGHSLGGMAIPMQPRLDGITRVICIGSGMVNYRDHPLPYGILVRAFWFVLGPVSTLVMGYLPGKTIGLGSTLPRRAFWQWRRWCLSDQFQLADVGSHMPAPDWGRCGAPVTLVSIADDAICPEVSARRLADIYDGAQIDMLALDPADFGLGKVGHFGFFSRKAAAMWPAVLPRGTAPHAAPVARPAAE